MVSLAFSGSLDSKKIESWEIKTFPGGSGVGTGNSWAANAYESRQAHARSPVEGHRAGREEVGISAMKLALSARF
jgi:hypothetical protein